MNDTELEIRDGFNTDDDSVDKMVDDMYRAAARGIGSDAESSTAHRPLDALIILSGVLSGIFFLLYGRQVFGELPGFVAFALALVCGLLPTEYAYWAWRRVRRENDMMTRPQYWTSGLAIAVAVGFAVFSTIAMFIAGFPRVPADIRQYADWFVFIALTFPLPIQFVLIAVYELTDRVVLENLTRARAHAIKFAAIQYFEIARVGAAMLGMKRRLAQQLKPYGAAVGTRSADRMLGRRPGASPAPSMPALPSGEEPALTDEDIATLMPAASPRRGWRNRLFGRTPQPAATHDAPRREIATPPATPTPGQGQSRTLSDADIAAIGTAFAAALQANAAAAPAPAPSANGQEASNSHPS